MLLGCSMKVCIHLWPNGVQSDNVLILISNETPNMKKAVEAPSESSPKIIYDLYCRKLFNPYI